MKHCVAAFAFLVSLSAVAQTFTFTPPYPNSLSNITMHIDATWPEDCPPEAPLVLTMDRNSALCITAECEPLSIRIGGVPATDVKRAGDFYTLTAIAPPHAAGAVDVEISNNAFRMTEPNALVYFRESDPPDYVLFEPLLFPFFGESDGADGTHWKADALLVNSLSALPLVSQRPLDALRYIPPYSQHAVRAPSGRPRGLVWLPLRVPANGGSASLTVRETTRGSSFEMPVVRQGDFSTYVMLTAIPRDRRYRVTLRVYSLDDPAPLPSSVEVFASGNETTFPQARTELTLARFADDEPYFAEVPDLELLPFHDFGNASDPFLQVGITSPGQRIWAFASIVDNETQQVRIVTPLRWAGGN